MVCFCHLLCLLIKLLDSIGWFVSCKFVLNTRFQFVWWMNVIGWMLLAQPFVYSFHFIRCRCTKLLSLHVISLVLSNASIVKYRFRQYFYYPHSTLIMFDIAASAPINSGDEMSSCAMPINFYCTIRLRRTSLMKIKEKKNKIIQLHGENIS